MYRDGGFKMSLDSILDKIDEINNSETIREFVITGGEPTADIDTLKIIVERCKKQVFINTTLPAKNAKEAISLINELDIVHGVNISRQFGKLNGIYHGISMQPMIESIDKPIRINVMRTEDWKEELECFMDKFITKPNMLLNLREDYRAVDKFNLKVRNEVVDYLANKYVFIGSSGCMVCNADTFVNAENGKYINYHRGIEHSCVRFEERTYVNDVIVRPDGKCFDDWDWKNELTKETIENIK